MRPNRGLPFLVILFCLAVVVLADEPPRSGRAAVVAAPGAAASSALQAAKPASETELLLPQMDVSQWEAANGLTTFWEKDPFRGRVARLDSRIEEKQAMAWEAVWRKNPRAKPPKPVFAEPPYYSSVGGNHGVILDSVLFAVEPGQDYKLTAEVKGTAGAYVWVKGFRKHPKRDMLLDSYQTRLDATRLDPDEWRTIAIGLNPTARSPHTEFMKVRLYAFWPVGITYFANVRLEKITPEEMAALVEERNHAPRVDE